MVSPPQLQNFINGEFVSPSTRTYIDNINPATGSVISLVPKSAAADVEAAIAAAKEAEQGKWATFSAQDRSSILLKIASLIEEELEEFARAESIDTGKPLTFARTVDIPRAVVNFRFFAGAVEHHVSDSTEMSGAINYTLHKPVGVCTLITPWNLPLYLLTWKIAPALACGNTVVCKPSEITPTTAWKLGNILNRAGVPPGVVNIVHGLGPDVGPTLVEHPLVRAVSFTGGTVTGRRVAQSAAGSFKKLSLELGGKNATVVFADCDYEKTILTTARSAFANSGQICLCGSRIFVERAIYDKYLEDFTAKVKALKLGDPFDAATTTGPVISMDHMKKMEHYVNLAVEEGGTIHCGGKRHLPEGYSKDSCFWEPTIITGLSPYSRCAKEEIFGPVVTIHPFDKDEEVLDYVNCTEYGLAGSVWTTNLTRAQNFVRQVSSGILWVNCWLLRDLRTPFGGVKNSGMGREGGRHSIEFYTEQTNVCIAL